MANKKDEGISYGSVTLPNSERRYSLIRWGWRGLNRTHIIDSGNITDCSNVYIDPTHVDVCADIINFTKELGGNILEVFGFDNFLILIEKRVENNTISIIQILHTPKDEIGKLTVVSKTLGPAREDGNEPPRSIVQFNTAVNTENIAAASYVRKILVYPDMVSFELKYDEVFDVHNVMQDPQKFDIDGSPQPPINYAAVYASRLFGVSNTKVYASQFNNYSGWKLDTADDISEANAWMSMTQSNPKMDGLFTGIWVYNNHVMLFRQDFIQMVYSNNNPFRIVDLASYGADSQKAITEANGVLYFASRDNVYAFTGGVPRAIGDDLGIPDYRGACLGYFKDKLYMCVGNDMYIYRNGVWSARHLDKKIIQFATNDNGLYGLVGETGQIFLIDSDDHEKADGTGKIKYGDWWFETDLMCAGKLDIKRAKKISLLVDADKGSSVSVYLLRDDEEFDPNMPKVLSFDNFGHSGKRVLRGMIRGFGGFAHKLRIAGHGKVRVYAAELLVTLGGDLYRSE